MARSSLSDWLIMLCVRSMMFELETGKIKVFFAISFMRALFDSMKWSCLSDGRESVGKRSLMFSLLDVAILCRRRQVNFM